MTSTTERDKPTKSAVAVVIYDAHGQFLAVRRAEDDESLPGVWGLPAASLRPGEDDEDAVIRAGRDKLGVELEPRTRIGADTIDRGDYTLHLTDYVATVTHGEPSVPQPHRGVSQYAALQYTDDLHLLVEAARRGSLCSRVFLDSRGHPWRR